MIYSKSIKTKIATAYKKQWQQSNAQISKLTCMSAQVSLFYENHYEYLYQIALSALLAH